MKRGFRIIALVLGSMLGIVLVAGVVFYLIGNARLNKLYDFPASNITLFVEVRSPLNSNSQVC
jgi:hypothetical protein